MSLRTTLMKVTAFLLCAVSFRVAAVTIDADLYPAGTDITHVADGATLNHYTHEAYSDSILYEPAISLDYQQTKALDASYWNIRYLEYLEGYEPLSELGDFSGLSITFDQAVRNFRVTAYNAWGDDFFAFLFDENDTYLGYLTPTTAKYYQPGCDRELLSCAHYTIHANLSGEPVYRVAFGGDTTNTYLTRISFSVPEPSSLALLSIGLLGFGVSVLRRTRQAIER